MPPMNIWGEEAPERVRSPGCKEATKLKKARAADVGAEEGIEASMKKCVEETATSSMILSRRMVRNLSRTVLL